MGSEAMTKEAQRGENKLATHDLHIFLFGNSKSQMLQIPDI